MQIFVSESERIINRLFVMIRMLILPEPFYRFYLSPFSARRGVAQVGR